MKSDQMTHHPNKDGNQFSTVEDEIEALRSANALTAVSADVAFANDNRLIRSDQPGGSGRKAQQSGVTLDDSNNMSGIGTLTASSLTPTNPVDIPYGGTNATTASAARANLAAEQIGTITGVNTQTSSYTLVLGDAGKVVEVNNASANTLTVPPNSSVAFPIGTYVNFAQIGAGQTTVTAGVGVTLRNRAGLKTFAQYSIGVLYKRGTDEWVVGGDMTT